MKIMGQYNEIKIWRGTSNYKLQQDNDYYGKCEETKLFCMKQGLYYGKIFKKVKKDE